MNKNKRGVSDVVTTVLMILLVIAAIGILWAVISNFVGRGTENVADTAECLAVQFQIDSAKNVTETIANISVKRVSGSADVTELKFFVDGASTTASGTVPGVGETRVFSMTGLSSPAGKKVGIAAVVGDTTCNIADEETITTN